MTARENQAIERASRYRRVMGHTAPILGVLFLLAACSPDPKAPLDAAPRGVVIVSLDTLRRDHLPTYGYERDTAPEISSLAEQSAVFWHAYAQDTNTNPSHTSMLTGLYPHEHGNQWNGERLSGSHPTLATILREVGFRTAAFVSGAAMRSQATGLERGFEIYEDHFESRRRGGSLTVGLAVEWLRELSRGERFFLFVHLYDSHGPYRPRPASLELFRSEQPGPALRRVPDYQRWADGHAGRELTHLNHYIDRYDATIRDCDDAVGALLAQLDLEETVVVVLSDHGETLGERFHKLDHGAQVFDEQIRIPLLVAAPRFSARQILGAVETVDLLPSLLELLGLGLPDGLELAGASFVPMMVEGTGGRGRVFSSARAVSARHADRGYELAPDRRIHSVRTRRWKLILYPGVASSLLELYDMQEDPWERKDVAAQHPDILDSLHTVLRGWLALGEQGAAPKDLSLELRQQLEELGYVDDE